MRINFHKRSRCSEAKKAINHELETHGYGSGEEEDGKSDDDEGCVCWWHEYEEEEERIRLLGYLWKIFIEDICGKYL